LEEDLIKKGKMFFCRCWQLFYPNKIPSP